MFNHISSSFLVALEKIMRILGILIIILVAYTCNKAKKPDNVKFKVQNAFEYCEATTDNNKDLSACIKGIIYGDTENKGIY